MKLSRWVSGRARDDAQNRAVGGDANSAPEQRQEPDRAVLAHLAAQIQQIEQRSPHTDDARWVQPGEAVAIRGAIISGGAFYVGTALSCPLLHGDEPALVNPALAVEIARPTLRDTDMQYWPRYDSLTPGQRATYLSWLASDRNLVRLPIGYVFLYFYGFERRVFLDLLGTPELDAELPWIRAEVERLQRVYGSNPSLNGYAQRFLWAIECLGGGSGDLAEPPAVAARSWRVPDAIKLGLGRLSAAGRPIPGNWALAWLKSDPEAFMRTPAERCPDEFGRLFVLRYGVRYGDGLVVESSQKLRLEYRPASRSFGSIDLPIGSVPNVTGHEGPMAELRDLAQECTDALDPFSRWIRRHADDHSSLAAISLLPADLIRAASSPALDEMSTWLETELADREEAVVDGGRLLSHWPRTPSGKLTARDSAALGQLLSAFGYGIEPDARLGGPAFGPGRVVIFRDTTPEAAAGPRLDRMYALLDLAVTVAAIRDPDVDTLNALCGQLAQALELPETDRPRVRAHLHWASIESPKLTLAKRMIREEGQRAREEVGTFLVDWATQRGGVGPDQVAGLTKAFTALGLEPASLFSLIHQRTVNPSSDPVEIRAPGGSAGGEAIPPAPSAGAGGTVDLEGTALEAALASTAASNALLGKIFVDDEVPTAAPVAAQPGNLGGAYKNLLSQLAERPSWSMSEFAGLVANLNLLPNRAIEVLNEAALDLTGEPLLEGAGILEVNRDALKELLE
jgi:TerB N-terminal domain/TerB-C domain